MIFFPIVSIRKNLHSNIILDLLLLIYLKDVNEIIKNLKVF